MKKYTGDIFWVKLDIDSGATHGGGKAKIHRAILIDNVFKIDHKNPNDLPDSEIRLKSTDDFKFDGSAKYINSTKSNALVNLEYYYNSKKAIMTGTWIEDKIEFYCLIKLTEVDSFKD